jgi:long-subunit acyl-CoA synthetase (AMP-forming)
MKDNVDELYLWDLSILPEYYINAEDTGKALEDGWIKAGNITIVTKDGQLFNIKKAKIMSNWFKSSMFLFKK